MVNWTSVLSDAAIEAAVGTPAYNRGRAYARNGHVGHLKINRNVIFGRVHGTAPNPYQLIVVAGEDRAATRVSATCTCPVGVDCQHAAAAMIAAREHVANTTDPQPQTWRQALDELVESHTDTAEPAPLALQFTVEPDDPASFGDESTGVHDLVVRPLAMGKRGRWVRKGAGWRDMRHTAEPSTHRRDHLDVLHRMNSLTDGLASLNPNAAGVELGEFGPSVWRLLEEARDVGIEFVSDPTGFYVELNKSRAVTCLDTVRDPSSGALVISPALRIGDELVDLTDVEPIGWPMHGAFRAAGSSIELIALAEPPGERIAALFGRTIEVPADEVESFLADYYPVLGRVVPLTSADESVELPEIATPRLQVVAEFAPDHVVRLSWAYAYGSGTSERTYALDDPTSPTARDQRDERELWVRATRIVEKWWPLLDRTGMLAAEGTLHGIDVVEFCQDALPVLTRDDDIDVHVVGRAPRYEEADSDPLVHVAATEDDDAATDWFDLHVTVTVGDEEVPFEALFAALARGDTHLILDSGTYFRIDDPDLDRLRRLLEEARVLTEHPTDQLRNSQTK